MVGVPEACSLVPVADHAKVVGRVDERHGDVEEGESGDACDSASHVFVRHVFAVAVGPFDVGASPPGSVPCAACPVMGLLKFDDFLGWGGGDGSLGATFRKRFSGRGCCGWVFDDGETEFDGGDDGAGSQRATDLSGQGWADDSVLSGVVGLGVALHGPLFAGFDGGEERFTDVGAGVEGWSGESVEAVGCGGAVGVAADPTHAIEFFEGDFAGSQIVVLSNAAFVEFGFPTFVRFEVVVAVGDEVVDGGW